MSEDVIAPSLLNDVSGPLCEFCCNSSYNRSSMTIDGDDHDSDPLMNRRSGTSDGVQNDFDFLLSQFDPKELMVVQDVYREFHIDPKDPNPSAEACISYLVQAKGDQNHHHQQQQSMDNIFDDLQLLIGYPEKNSTSQAMINQRYQIMRHALNKDNLLLPRPESTVYEYFNIFRGKIRLEMQNRERMFTEEHFVDQLDPEQIDQRFAEERDHLLDFWNKQVIQRTNLMFQPEKSYRFQENWPPLLMNVPEEYFSADEASPTAEAVIKQPESMEPPRKRRRRRRCLTRRKRGGSKRGHDKRRPKTDGQVFCLDQLIDSISNGSMILEAETEQQQPSQSLSSSSSTPTTSIESDATIKVSEPDDDHDEATVPVHHTPSNNDNNESPIQMQQWECVTYVQPRLPSSTGLSNESEQALQPWFDDSTPPPPPLVPVSTMVHHQQEEVAAAATAEEETVNVTFIYDEQDTSNNNSSPSNDPLQINLFDLGLKKEEEPFTNDVRGGNSGIVETFDDDDDEPEPEPVPLLSVMVSLDKYITDTGQLYARCNQLFEMIKSRNPGIDPAAAADFRSEFRSTLEQLKLVELGGYNPTLSHYESWIACYWDGEYSKAMHLCEMVAYPDHLHRPMQEIWDHSLEMLESIRRNHQKLSSVQRFRLKQKHEYPDTIWDGKRVKYGMSVLHKKVLIFFYNNYSKNPTSAQKDRLASMVNASAAHVSTFFKNRRSRSGDTRKGGRTLKQEITESEWQILEQMLKSES